MFDIFIVVIFYEVGKRYVVDIRAAVKIDRTEIGIVIGFIIRGRDRVKNIIFYVSCKRYEVIRSVINIIVNDTFSVKVRKAGNKVFCLTKSDRIFAVTWT